MSRVNGAPLKLWDARCEFAFALGSLLVWANTDPSMTGFRVALGEGLVAVTDAADGDHDGPHKAGGAHYTGLGVDLLVYDVAGTFVVDGYNLAYRRLGEQWRRSHYLAAWGGDFVKPDHDHFSFRWEGKV